jgi:hypothetical protein
LSFAVCPAADDEPAKAGVTSLEKAGSVEKSPFEKSVAPLLAAKCVACHSGSEAKAGLDLTQREKLLVGGESGTAVVPGKPDQSPIWQRVSADEMPPKHPLSAAEKLIIKSWIEAGAVWSGGPLDPLKVSSDQRAGYDWWSLQPLAKMGSPTVQNAARLRQPIDAFVEAGLESHGLNPADPAGRRVMIRRLTYDLIGLPPTPEDVAEFVADDRPDACERLIDRLLASPHYGERWARHWLDVVRFGESNGFERDLPRPNAWPYRDWVIQALNRDMPYDDFVRWQLAGDVIAPDDPQAIQAVGFLVAGAHDTVVPVVDRMRAAMRQDELEDTIGVVGQTFLGLTIGCARCHDHKFDPITAKEYYQFASALGGVDHGEREFTPPEVTRQLSEGQFRIDALTKRLQEQESPIREKILAERKRPAADRTADGDDPNRSPAPNAPVPIAAWDFTRDAKDQVGRMDARLVGTAKLEREGLVVDGRSYAMTSPLEKDLVAKTLEVRVKLQTRQQSGGGAISLQTIDGHTFDAIVYAEQEPNRWMPGSNGFQRTASFGGTAEEQADKQFVTITQVHAADGTITGYRNGQPYGRPVRKDQAVRFEAGKCQIVFGLRHGTEAGGNRMLNGTIAAARLFDRALSAEEVAISADATNSFITETEIAARLSPEERAIRASRQGELADLRLKHAELAKSAPVKIYSAIATQPPPMRIHKRGSVSMLGDEVAPAGLAAIQSLNPDFGLKPDAIESHRRTKLADWITDSRNPLFARVMANRVWHYHFGAGLVDTPSDLGFSGGRPSHPELLEWLAGEFAGNSAGNSVGNSARNPAGNASAAPARYSIKRLHRLILTSATYCQSSAFDAEAARIDAANRLLWRMNPHRLEAESVRDAILSVAGELNDEIGGKGYSDVKSYFFKGTQFYDPIDPPGYANNRRTVYRMWARGGRSPFLDTFDCPDPSSTTPRRSATVTPLQALSLLNHSFSLRMADRFADRLKTEAGADSKAGADSATDTAAEVQLAYRLLYGREPSAEELQLSKTFIDRRGLPAFCRAMWSSSEFLFVD